MRFEKDVNRLLREVYKDIKERNKVKRFYNKYSTTIDEMNTSNSRISGSKTASISVLKNIAKNNPNINIESPNVIRNIINKAQSDVKFYNQTGITQQIYRERENLISDLHILGIEISEDTAERIIYSPDRDEVWSIINSLLGYRELLDSGNVSNLESITYTVETLLTELRNIISKYQ